LAILSEGLVWRYFVKEVVVGFGSRDEQTDSSFSFQGKLIFRGGQTLDEEGGINSRDWIATAKWVSQSNHTTHDTISGGAHTTELPKAHESHTFLIF
jgi:hypothetical protein